MAAYLANVGVNAAHRVRSPLHPDGSFELLPIPEKEPWAPPMLRLPGIWAGRAVHLAHGVGGIRVGDLLEARRAAGLGSEEVLVATSSRCHAAVGALRCRRSG